MIPLDDGNAAHTAEACGCVNVFFCMCLQRQRTSVLIMHVMIVSYLFILSFLVLSQSRLFFFFFLLFLFLFYQIFFPIQPFFLINFFKRIVFCAALFIIMMDFALLPAAAWLPHSSFNHLSSVCILEFRPLIELASLKYFMKREKKQSLFSGTVFREQTAFLFETVKIYV